MQTPWIFSSTFLPYTGEPIDFLLEDRSEPIHGVFVDGQFHSRWADYGVDRVQSWRGLDADSSLALIEVPKTAKAGAFIATVRRLTRVFSGRRGDVAPIVPPHCRARTDAAAPVAKPRAAAAARHFHSNQISS
jgi:hypothetical protein